MTEKSHSLTKQILLTFDVEVYWWKNNQLNNQGQNFCVAALQLVIILKMPALVNSRRLTIKECGMPAFSCKAHFYIRNPKADS